MQHTRPGRVAVIGLGAAGLTATKNLVEQGFDVTAFDRNDRVGGLWTFKDDPSQTTVLRTTHTNGSKQISPYQDFPFPADLPNYPSGEQVSEYMHDYAKHFSLGKHFRLNTEIQLISPRHLRSDTADTDNTASSSPGSVEQIAWEIKLRDAAGERVETFDKVLVTSGPWARPFTPEVKGMGSFEGKLIHSQSFKSAAGYQGRKVMIVGMANTACDIAMDLCNEGAEVYMSHRHGVMILKREDPPIDHQITRRRFLMGAAMNNRFPSLLAYLGSKVIERKFRKANPEYQEEWGFFPVPPLWTATGVINDKIVQMMVEGKINNRHGLKRFTQTGVVTATKDGQGEVETQVDTVLFATSEDFDYSILDPDVDPTRRNGPEWEQLKHKSNDLAFPRLYQTLFSTRYPHSLAFIGPSRGFSVAALSNYDLSSQAIAQVWSGRFPLPTCEEMERWCDGMYQRTVEQAKVYRVGKTGTDSAAFEHWLNEAAGNEMNSKLGWGWEAWKFWWSDRKLHGLIMDGVQSPHVYRLFEGRGGARKKWKGARDAIYRANGLAPS